MKLQLKSDKPNNLRGHEQLLAGLCLAAAGFVRTSDSTLPRELSSFGRTDRSGTSARNSLVPTSSSLLLYLEIDNNCLEKQHSKS